MAQLVKIGNSQGIRIPKPLVEQAQLEGKELTLTLTEQGLLITPEKSVRQGWQEAIEKTLATQSGNDPAGAESDWLDMSLDSDEDLEW